MRVAVVRKREVRRRGVTLVEILLALALTVVLVGAIHMSIDLYTRLSVAGREEAEQSQLARAILRRIEIDLRSVVYREPEQVAAEDAALEGSTEEETITIEVTDPADAYTGASVGLFGDAQTLVLHVSRPVRGLNYSPLLDGEFVAERTSDLQSVAYFLAESGAQGLRGMLSDTDGAQTSAGAVQGLARLEGDRMAMDLAGEQANQESLARNTRLLAAEVDFLAFRYFDGLEWWETWDSVAEGRLPQAVEVTLGLRSGVDADDEVLPSQKLYHLVVAVPLAQPYVAQTEL